MILVYSHQIEWTVISEKIEKRFSVRTVYPNKLEFIVNNNNKKKKQPPNLLNVISCWSNRNIHCKRMTTATLN